jgi:hypothetical protein
MGICPCINNKISSDEFDSLLNAKKGILGIVRKRTGPYIVFIARISKDLLKSRYSTRWDEIMLLKQL